MTAAALLIGFARTIEVVLSQGQIMDTVIYGIASVLENTGLMRYHLFSAALALVLALLLFRTTRTDDLIKGAYREPEAQS